MAEDDRAPAHHVPLELARVAGATPVQLVVAAARNGDLPWPTIAAALGTTQGVVRRAWGEANACRGIVNRDASRLPRSLVQTS